MDAVETSVPLYENVSERISLNLASALRRRAISVLGQRRSTWVLDSGAGPGISTRVLLEYGFEKVVGLDPSMRLLKFARSRLGHGFEPVVGTAEHLPFRDGAFGAVLACFSLRDARDQANSLREFARTGVKNCLLALVDVGKPDAAFSQRLVALYVRHVMPTVAWLLVRNRLIGNPFREIVPTFERLITNRSLGAIVEKEFGPVELSEFLLGGLVILDAVRRTPWSESSESVQRPVHPGFLQPFLGRRL